MWLVPEYEPVRKIAICFVQDFFNTRFGYGKTLCEIIRASQATAEIELWISPDDLPYFQEECRRYQVALDGVSLNFPGPGRAIIAEYVPNFMRDESGSLYGLIYRNPLTELPEEKKIFAQQWTAQLGMGRLDFGYDFATAHLLVNEELVLLSSYFFEGEDRQARLNFFSEHFPRQKFEVVPPLAGDLTTDLDMYLWPIAPKVWIVSEYAPGTAQAESIAPALAILQRYGHSVHRVPGLEAIIHDDVNTMPNYANGVILNGIALAPAYQRREDEIVTHILESYGYIVKPIDCSQVILSNSGVHCISKTVPAAGK